VILIDTHVWIWYHARPEMLSATAIGELEKADRIAMSVLSIYETMVAADKGRLNTSSTPEMLVRRWLDASDITRIPVSEDIVLQSRSLNFQHADPFDRIITATALCANCPLMTADHHLLRLDWLPTIAAQ